MKYGSFDDETREYVITTPKTPYPWINYLGTESFFSLISHQAGGYCFYRDAKLRRFTRYRYNNVPTDVGGRYFYINDGGDVWSPSFMPVKRELDSFECRHGLGYTKHHRRARRAAAPSSSSSFRSATTPRSTRSRSPTSGSAKQDSQALLVRRVLPVERAGRPRPTTSATLSIGEVEVDGSTIYHKTEYRERRDHYAVYHVTRRSPASTPIATPSSASYNGLG